MDAINDKTHIKERLKELEILITDTRKRLPAHSVKPRIMTELLELEDEYFSLMEKL